MARPNSTADVFRVIADPTRRAILDRLRAGPAPVNELAADFDQTRPAISKHLRVLARRGSSPKRRSVASGSTRCGRSRYSRRWRGSRATAGSGSAISTA